MSALGSAWKTIVPLETKAQYICMALPLPSQLIQGLPQPSTIGVSCTRLLVSTGSLHHNSPPLVVVSLLLVQVVRTHLAGVEWILKARLGTIACVDSLASLANSCADPVHERRARATAAFIAMAGVSIGIIKPIKMPQSSAGR